MLKFSRRRGSTLFRYGSLVLAFLLIVLVWTLWNHQRHHVFASRELTLAGTANGIVTMVDDEGNEATLTGSADLFLDGGTQTVRYMDRVMHCKVDWSSGNYLYTFNDGTAFTLPPRQVGSARSGVSGTDDLTPLQQEELSLFATMQRMQDKGSTLPTALWKGLVSLVILLMGMAMICFPAAIWRIGTLPIVRDGEPTEWALISSALAGVFLILTAFLLPFIW